MPVKQINHYALLACNMEETIEFYTSILGLVHGPKLNGGFGEFLFFPNSNQACVHLLDDERAKLVDNNKPEGFQLYATPGKQHGKQLNTNAVDHIAFATDKPNYDEVISILKSKNIDYRLGEELAPDILQVWFFDPNGVKVEVTYNKNDPV